VLDLNLLEQNPIFVLDTNALNRLPRELLEVFDFYCPQGVVREVERWTSLLELLPQHMVRLEEEIAHLGEILKIKDWLEEARGMERYPEVSELVERLFLEEKLSELSSKRNIEEWEEAIKQEGQRILDELERERRNYNLAVVKAVLTSALSRGQRVRLEAQEEPSQPDLMRRYLGDRDDLKVISSWCRKAAGQLKIDFEEGEEFLSLGPKKASEESPVPFFSYSYLRQAEEEREKKLKELERVRRGHEELQRRGEERENALSLIEELRNRGRVIPRKDDWITSSLHSYTALLSKTLARDVLREHAPLLAKGEKGLPLVEKGLELYRRRAVKGVEEAYEERLKGKLRSHFSQLLEQIERERPEKDAEAFVSALADDFQSEESLRVDVEVLRASFKISDEFPREMVFIVTEDSDLIDLFLLSRDLRSRLFPNVRYCETPVLEEFYLRLKRAKARIRGLEEE